MRVIHVITSLERGGIESWLLDMLQVLSKEDVQQHFCCKGSSTGVLTDKAIGLGAEVISCPLGPWHVGFQQRLQDIIASGGFDIVHNHIETYSGIVVHVCRQLGVPVVSSFHNTRFHPHSLLLGTPPLRQIRSLYDWISVRYALGHSTLITGCSRAVLHALDRYSTDYRARARVVYYGIDLGLVTTEHERAVFRRELNMESDAHLVLHVGNFRPQKNHRGVVDVFRLVVDQIPSARLLLIGDGPLRASTESYVRSAGLEHAVSFMGSRDDVRNLMRYCDVFLFPSLFEGFGLVALEANAAGLPVVGADHPAIAEAVVNNKSALLHDVTDISGMADSIARIVQNRDLARSLGDYGRERSASLFSKDASAHALKGIYDESLDIS